MSSKISKNYYINFLTKLQLKNLFVKYAKTKNLNKTEHWLFLSRVSKLKNSIKPILSRKIYAKFTTV